MHRIFGLTLMAARFSRPAAVPGAPIRWCRQRGRPAATLVAALLLAVNAQAARVFTAVVTHVSDGDTLWVLPDSGGPSRKLRLDGIDAPEICQHGGVHARAALERLALNQRVTVQVRRRDDYGRELARVQVDRQDLGSLMVREGQAWSSRWRRHPGPYATEESDAREARRGLFAADRPEPPRDFRRRHGPCPAPVR